MVLYKQGNIEEKVRERLVNFKQVIVALEC